MDANQARLAVFLTMFTVMGLLEFIIPKRPWRVNKPYRWSQNMLLMIVNSIAMKWILPIGVTGIAYWAQLHGIGLLNSLSISESILSLTVSILFLDLVIYTQHVVFHKVPILWALHQVHHAENDLDVTSGTRFHTLEMIISLGIKAGVTLLLGISPIAILVFEIILNATAMFNHSNIALPKWLDAPLRLLVVTPDMHRVHHSIHQTECMSNYGFNLPWWDRIFKTYIAQPKDGHDQMVLGLSHTQKAEKQSIFWILLYPFKQNKIK